MFGLVESHHSLDVYGLGAGLTHGTSEVSSRLLVAYLPVVDKY